MMKYLIFFLFISSTLSAQKLNRRNRIGKPFIYALTGGLDKINSRDFNNWITKNGGYASSKYGYNFGVKIVCPTASNIMLGGSINWAQTSSPSKQDLYFTALIGYLFKSSVANIIPSFELGEVTSSITFNKNIPIPLMQLHPQGGVLTGFALLIKPNVLIEKNFHPYMIGIEFGCKIYALSSKWRYYENGTNNSSVSVPQIPFNSFAYPYISLLIGYDFGL